jgi:ferredoxin-type protein NapG
VDVNPTNGYENVNVTIQRTHLSHHNGVIVVLKQLHMAYMRLFSVRQCLVLKRNLSTLNSYIRLKKDMDRRNFFKNVFARTVDAGVGALDHRAQAKAKHWFRPPFAKDELEFLLACTRCNQCVEACPHQVIFNLPIRAGAEVAGTPALDLTNKGCHLCSDWACVSACVSACKDDALVFPPLADGETSEILPASGDCPPLGTANINEQVCIAYSGPECGACRGSCPLPDTLLWRGEKPYINADSCLGCGLCREVCITSPKAVDVATL